MAKLEKDIRTDLSKLMAYLERGILEGSVSASLEEKSTLKSGDVTCEVRVYERYSWLGGNRLSLSVTALDAGDGIVHLSAIASGGSQAMLVKVNTFGESNFLEAFRNVLDNYQKF